MRSHSGKLKEQIANLNDVIEQTYYFEQKVFEWGNKVKVNKEKISKAMGNNKKLEVVVDEETAFKAVKTINTEVDFIPEKLKESLNKETFAKVVDKTVTINNLDGLIGMLKDYGVPPKRFKEFIKVKNDVSIEKIDNLIEMGEIEIEQIQGCYKVVFDEIIKVSKTK
jgi:type 1 glutamine amidotransferase